MISFWDNLLLGIALTLPLGPVTVLIVRNGLAKGPVQSVHTALGAFQAELCYFSLAYAGASRIASLPQAKISLGILGVLFMSYIAIGSIVEFFRPADYAKIDTTLEVASNSFVMGFLVTFLNPANFFMWVGIIGSNMAQNGSLLICSGVLAGILPSLFSFVVLTAFCSRFLSKDIVRYISLGAGLFMIFYSIKLFIGVLGYLK